MSFQSRDQIGAGHEIGGDKLILISMMQIDRLMFYGAMPPINLGEVWA